MSLEFAHAHPVVFGIALGFTIWFWFGFAKIIRKIVTGKKVVPSWKDTSYNRFLEKAHARRAELDKRAEYERQKRKWFRPDETESRRRK